MLNQLKLLFIATITGVLFFSCTNEQKQQESANTMATSESTAQRGCNSIITDEPYDIPPQRFDETAQQLSHATGCFIETDLKKTGAIQVNAVKGKISISDAIRMAIKDTGLKIADETSEKLVVELDDSEQ